MIDSAISFSEKKPFSNVPRKKRLATSLFTKYLIYCTLLSKLLILLFVLLFPYKFSFPINAIDILKKRGFLPLFFSMYLTHTQRKKFFFYHDLDFSISTKRHNSCQRQPQIFYLFYFFIIDSSYLYSFIFNHENVLFLQSDFFLWLYY